MAQARKVSRERGPAPARDSPSRRPRAGCAPPKLKPTQAAHLVELWQGGERGTLELAELFSVSRATVYRAIQRGGAGTPSKAT